MGSSITWLFSNLNKPIVVAAGGDVALAAKYALVLNVVNLDARRVLRYAKPTIVNAENLRSYQGRASTSYQARPGLGSLGHEELCQRTRSFVSHEELRIRATNLNAEGLYPLTIAFG